ncbi:MAG: BREX system Lon protease-like protein BrxL [bacterium]
MNTEKGTVQKLRDIFSTMLVFKDPAKSKFFSSLSIPSYLRDWLVMKFSDENGSIDYAVASDYVKQNIPRKEHWELLKSDMIKSGKTVRFLGKLRVEIDVTTGGAFFTLPDLGFPSRKQQAFIDDQVLRTQRDSLLSSAETWGILECEWRPEGFSGKPSSGAVIMVGFRPFRPYQVDLEYFCQARAQFTLAEWIDLLLMAIDYNPAGFADEAEKFTMLSRLLPFLEKRVNLVELAPKGTGKSYLFSQISKYGWLVSGGSISRARLFFDISKKSVGLMTRYDYVAFDEIQTIHFPDVDEMRGALKGYLESGNYSIGDYRGVGDAGLVLMGNIPGYQMDENRNMFTELPIAFQESAMIDRFHGFIKGWQIPRMRENMKARGWSLNVEYFSEILHALREEIRYRAIVDELIQVPKGSDTRDTEAIKRLATAFVKLLFPNVSSVADVDCQEFEQFCLKPAMEMRKTIRTQLHLMDREYSPCLPMIEMKNQGNDTGSLTTRLQDTAEPVV